MTLCRIAYATHHEQSIGHMPNTDGNIYIYISTDHYLPICNRRRENGHPRSPRPVTDLMQNVRPNTDHTFDRTIHRAFDRTMDHTPNITQADFPDIFSDRPNEDGKITSWMCTSLQWGSKKQTPPFAAT